MIILPKTLVAASGCSEEGLMFDKDWEKDITQETMDVMLYGKPCPNTTNRKAFVSLLRTTNLMYICRLIHSFLFNIVMPRLGSRDYVCDRDKLCMYKVMVSEKVNLPEVIFFYWLQTFKDKF